MHITGPNTYSPFLWTLVVNKIIHPPTHQLLTSTAAVSRSISSIVCLHLAHFIVFSELQFDCLHWLTRSSGAPGLAFPVAAAATRSTLLQQDPHLTWLSGASGQAFSVAAAATGSALLQQGPHNMLCSCFLCKSCGESLSQLLTTTEKAAFDLMFSVQLQRKLSRREPGYHQWALYGALCYRTIFRVLSGCPWLHI